MTALADRFPSLTRHWQVLRESWRLQNERDQHVRPRADAP